MYFLVKSVVFTDSSIQNKQDWLCNLPSSCWEREVCEGLHHVMEVVVALPATQNIAVNAGKIQRQRQEDNEACGNGDLT